MDSQDILGISQDSQESQDLEEVIGDLYTVFVLEVRPDDKLYGRFSIVKSSYFDQPGCEIPSFNKPEKGRPMDILQRTIDFDIKHPTRPGEKVTCYLFGRSRKGK